MSIRPLHKKDGNLPLLVPWAGLHSFQHLASSMSGEILNQVPDDRSKRFRIFLLSISKDKGFSLVEIMIGIVLLAVGLLAIAGMQMASIRGNSFSVSMTQASFHGQSGLEILKGLPFKLSGDWPDALSIGPHNFGSAFEDDGTIPGTSFTRAYTVIQHPTSANMRIIQLTINWTDRINHTLSFSMMRLRP